MMAPLRTPAEAAEDNARRKRYLNAADRLLQRIKGRREYGAALYAGKAHLPRWLHFAVTWEQPYGRDNVLPGKLYR